jgi:hypothetical protein
MCCCCGPLDILSIPLMILCGLNTIFGVTIVLDFFDKFHIYSTADVNKDVTWSFRPRFTTLMAWFAIHVMLCLAWVAFIRGGGIGSTPYGRAGRGLV